MDTVKSQGVVNSDPQNTADPKGMHTRSQFSDKDLGYSFYCTLPFGEVRPFTFLETVPDDKRIRAQFLSQVNSYTLKAPLMQGIHMKKLLCQVPREAILPNNWEKWFKNPVIGQDIATIAPDAGTSVLGFWHHAHDLCTAYQNAIPSSTTIDSATKAGTFVSAWFRFLLICEMFYSDGNLLKHCGISGRPWFLSYQSDGHTLNTVDYCIDTFVGLFLQDVVSNLSTQNFILSFSATDKYTVEPSLDPNRPYPGKYINMREALSLMRDNLNFTFEFIGSSATDITVVESFRNNLSQITPLATITFVDDTPTDPSDAVSVDLKRLWAYQLCTAHFLTNDSVDFLYTAELYRQYVGDLVTAVVASPASEFVPRFQYNGLNYMYDHLSARNFIRVIWKLTGVGTGNTYPPESNCLAYLCALFSFKRSLRFLDYFTGSKTRPLAVGDVNVQVNSNLVNVVDTQAKTFLARMLNAINRSGMRNYVEAIFNVKQAPDWHNPQYLVKLDDIVTGERVENTASEQWQQPNSVTSLLHGNSDRFAFEMDFDRSSIVIGLCWFDIDRVYSMATERQNLHFDRWDEFQPFMQYTGDQSLMRVELGTPLISGGSALPTDAFGYKLRNCEYKERFDQCAGGFCNDMLDGYIFKADVLEANASQNQSPSFIRSFPSELDRFYLSLSGYSLGTYFHFIVKFTNLYSGSRPMAYAPTLL